LFCVRDLYDVIEVLVICRDNLLETPIVYYQVVCCLIIVDLVVEELMDIKH
jgi:hypothetical protein